MLLIVRHSLPPAQPLLLGTSQGLQAGRGKWRKIIALSLSNTTPLDKTLGFQKLVPKTITGGIMGLIF